MAASLSSARSVRLKSWISVFLKTEIYSHPHILECCSDFLDALETRRQNVLKENYVAMERCNSWDSAAACKELMRDYSQSQAGEGAPKKAMACICSREAAALYGLRILVSSIGNDKNAEVSQSILSDYIQLTFTVASRC
jgi:prephenate dehydratase